MKEQLTLLPFGLMPEVGYQRDAVLLRIIDGDTFDVEIDLGWSVRLKERLRLELVDTPEINRKAEKQAGKLVKAHIEELLPVGTSLVLKSMAYSRTGRVRGKYGRTMAVVFRATDGWCLNEYLLQERLAWETNRKGELLGERDLALLTGLDKLSSSFLDT